MKTHVNLATTDLNASVTFYRTLLDAAPLKHYNDYALFVLDDPGLELALSAESAFRPARDVHFGVVVETAEAVDRAIERLRQGGYTTDVEVEETCCYAKQNKVWTADPDGRRWEPYVVLEESENNATREGCCAAS